jgi:D-3-phosphoglycerate dehydrogenase
MGRTASWASDAAKTLGIIGCGNIGSIVANRAISLHMKVISFSPICRKSAPLPSARQGRTRRYLNRADSSRSRAAYRDEGTSSTRQRRQVKDGVRIINCARGGLVVEEDLAAATSPGRRRRSRRVRHRAG